jgi:DNA-binding transcriptional ArsR family regulator
MQSTQPSAGLPPIAPTAPGLPTLPDGQQLDVMRQSAEQACRLLKVLSNPDRLLLLCQLSHGERRVGELEAEVGIAQPTLSQQLAVLREEGLVSTRREGKAIHYRIASPQAMAVMHVLYAHFCAPGTSAPPAAIVPCSLSSASNPQETLS